MRPLLALLISAALLGGTYAYTQFASQVYRAPVDYQPQFADEEYTVEIYRSFDLVTDPITGFPPIVVKLKGETVLKEEEPVPTDQPLVIQPLEGVEVGENDLYIAANRGTTDSTLAAIQVKIKKNGILICEPNVYQRSWGGTSCRIRCLYNPGAGC